MGRMISHTIIDARNINHQARNILKTREITKIMINSHATCAIQQALTTEEPHFFMIQNATNMSHMRKENMS